MVHHPIFTISCWGVLLGVHSCRAHLSALISSFNLVHLVPEPDLFHCTQDQHLLSGLVVDPGGELPQNPTASNRPRPERLDSRSSREETTIFHFLFQ